MAAHVQQKKALFITAPRRKEHRRASAVGRRTVESSHKARVNNAGHKPAPTACGNIDESRRQDAELESPGTKGCLLFDSVVLNQAKGGRSRCQKGAAGRDTGLPWDVGPLLPPDPSAIPTVNIHLCTLIICTIFCTYVHVILHRSMYKTSLYL